MLTTKIKTDNKEVYDGFAVMLDRNKKGKNVAMNIVAISDLEEINGEYIFTIEFQQ